MPHLLELVSRAGSIGRAFRAQGWEVTSVDINGAENPTIEADIRNLDVNCLGKVDAIWASPPCTNYSVARRSAEASADDLATSDDLVKRTLQLASDLGDPPLFIENPYTGGLKNRGLLDHMRLNKVDYCKYGFPYRKRTAVWTNTDWTPSRPLCSRDCAAYGLTGRKARAQQGGPGPRFTQRELYRIPPQLCDEIAQFCTASAQQSVSPEIPASA